VTGILRLLAGEWVGKGAGDYPTIEAFHYDEWLAFTLDESYPLLHYEQRTWLMPGREPAHWESGFFRPVESDEVEISNAQDGGRVEVLRGRGTISAPGRATLSVSNVAFGHDARLVSTRRDFVIDGDELRYEVQMATTTTPEPKLQRHLRAILTRQNPDA